MGNVYFIKIKGEPFVKVGYAQDVSRRLGELQTGCPYELQIMTVIPGTRKLEGLFHEALAPWRVRGEWFKTNAKDHSPVRKLMVLLNNGERPETLAAIQMLCDFAPRKGFGRGFDRPGIAGFKQGG